MVLSASRPCLAARPGAGALAAWRHLRRPAHVLGLVTQDRARVIGARLIPRADGSTEEIVHADLAVTTGALEIAVLLEKFGYRPAEEKVRPALVRNRYVPPST